MPTCSADLIRGTRLALAARFGRVEVTLGQRFTSSNRATVQRALARSADGVEHAVVLKAATGTGDSGSREQAALRLLADRGVPGVVPLLGTTDEPPLLVLDDLGSGPTLADRLLAQDPNAARTAVHGWAVALADLQANTVGLGPPYLQALRAADPAGTPSTDTSRESLAEAAAVLARDLPLLGITPGDDALEELLGLADDLDVTLPDAPGALVPGDTCPSNAVETAAGLVLLDFESAQYRHVAWEAAYLTVPWPSCWCSWALPADVAADALQVWQDRLAQTLPAVSTSGFDDDLARATTGWAFISTAWFLGSAVAGDPPPPDPARRHLIQTRKALLQRRLHAVATRSPGVLPALEDLAAQTHRAMLRQWGAHELPLAPAFR